MRIVVLVPELLENTTYIVFKLFAIFGAQVAMARHTNHEGHFHVVLRSVDHLGKCASARGNLHPNRHSLPRRSI